MPFMWLSLQAQGGDEVALRSRCNSLLCAGLHVRMFRIEANPQALTAKPEALNPNP